MKKLYIAMAGMIGCLPNFSEVYESHEEAVEALLTLHDLSPQSKYGEKLKMEGFTEIPVQEYHDEYMQIEEKHIFEYLDEAGVGDELEDYLDDPETPDFVRDYFREESEKHIISHEGLEIRSTKNGYMAYHLGKCLSLGDGVDTISFNDNILLANTEAWWDALDESVTENLEEMKTLVKEHGTWSH